ncbi:MAG: alpha/beta hydrolase [Bdellovibrionota bacterium]
MELNTHEEFVELSNAKLYVKCWKPKHNTNLTPIILFHDSLGSVELWRGFPERLCRTLKRPVIAYDRWGYGKSSPRESTLELTFIQDEVTTHLSELIEKLKLHRFALYGHSVGGAMAIVGAALKSELCDFVISESAQSFVEERTLQGIKKARASFRSPDLFSRLSKYHGDKAAWVLKAWTETWLAEEFRDWSLRSYLPQVKCPVLAIHGDNDEFGSVNFPKLICELAGASSRMLLLEDCGHVPHNECESQVFEEISRFVESL